MARGYSQSRSEGRVGLSESGNFTVPSEARVRASALQRQAEEKERAIADKKNKPKSPRVEPMPIYKEGKLIERLDSRGKPSGVFDKYYSHKEYANVGQIPDSIQIATAFKDGYPRLMRALFGEPRWKFNSGGYNTGFDQPPTASGPLREIYEKVYKEGSMYVDEQDGKNISMTFSKGRAKYELIANYVPVPLWSGEKNFGIRYGLRRLK